MGPTHSRQSIDYLIIGHLSADRTPEGVLLGGTAAYAGLTARALGLSVGLVTSAAADLDLSRLGRLSVSMVLAEQSTSFENIYTQSGRRQRLHSRAAPLTIAAVPEAWRRAPIVHLAPIADEVDPGILEFLSPSVLGMTPQGWMRTWDEDGWVSFKPWQETDFLLAHADAVVLSEEDIPPASPLLGALIAKARLLVVTRAAKGADLYRHGVPAHFPAHPAVETDPTGAGDVFAAAFFSQLLSGNPEQAIRYANRIAGYSVQRTGLDSVPQPSEVRAAEELVPR